MKCRYKNIYYYFDSTKYHNYSDNWRLRTIYDGNSSYKDDEGCVNIYLGMSDGDFNNKLAESLIKYENLEVYVKYDGELTLTKYGSISYMVKKYLIQEYLYIYAVIFLGYYVIYY